MSGRRRPGHSRRVCAVPVALVLAAALVAASGGAPAAYMQAARANTAQPRASLPVIERQVMCVTCKIPLNVAQSPQADRERAFIQSLIDEGRDEAQIKHALVDQYGSAALALPSAHGFDLAAYLVPLAACLALLVALAVLLPRWRRRAREQASVEPTAQTLSATDAARLDADLTRFD